MQCYCKTVLFKIKPCISSGEFLLAVHACKAFWGPSGLENVQVGAINFYADVTSNSITLCLSLYFVPGK